MRTHTRPWPSRHDVVGCGTRRRDPLYCAIAVRGESHGTMAPLATTSSSCAACSSRPTLRSPVFVHRGVGQATIERSTCNTCTPIGRPRYWDESRLVARGCLRRPCETWRLDSGWLLNSRASTDLSGRKPRQAALQWQTMADAGPHSAL